MNKGVTIIIIGIVGKTGSGKSTVAGYIQKKSKDALLIDADLVAKDIYRSDPSLCLRIKEHFENCVTEQGDVVFSSLAKKVFSDAKELRKLNKLMFPLIKSKIQDMVSENRQKKIIIIDAAVLFDAEINPICDYILWVKSPVEKRRKLLSEKNPEKSRQDLALRIKGQKIDIPKAKVDFIVTNDSDLKTLFKKIDAVLLAIKNNGS